MQRVGVDVGALATASQGSASAHPTIIRTASAEIMVALQDYVPATIDLHLAETPEIDALGAELQGHVNKLGTPRAKLARDEEAAMPDPGLFRAAAAFHRRAPWKLFPSDQDIVLFSVPALGVHEAVLSVMGQDGADSGLLLFFGVADFEAYVAAAVNDAGAFSRDGADIDKDKLPAHLALTFDAAKHIPPELRKIVRARRWELSSEDAYPAIMATTPACVRGSRRSGTQLLLEIPALGFVAFLEDESAVRRAYRTDTFHEDEFTLDTSQGPLAAILGGPVGAEADEDEDEDLGGHHRLNRDCRFYPEQNPGECRGRRIGRDGTAIFWCGTGTGARIRDAGTDWDAGPLPPARSSRYPMAAGERHI